MAINIKIISTDMDAAMPLPSLPTPKKLDSEKYNTDFEINGLPLGVHINNHQTSIEKPVKVHMH